MCVCVCVRERAYCGKVASHFLNKRAHRSDVHDLELIDSDAAVGWIYVLPNLAQHAKQRAHRLSRSGRRTHKHVLVRLESRLRDPTLDSIQLLHPCHTHAHTPVSVKNTISVTQLKDTNKEPSNAGREYAGNLSIGINSSSVSNGFCLSVGTNTYIIANESHHT